MRLSLLGHLVPLIRQPEPAATQALYHVLAGAPKVAAAFVHLLTGGHFEIGWIGSEWKIGRGSPDLAIYDADGKCRVFVENKFWALLTNQQPVAYLRELERQGGDVLAFIAPDGRRDSLWAELKERCEQERCELAEEMKTEHFHRMRVGDVALLLTSWRRVLETLRHAAVSAGLTTIEQDIIQLTGLAERRSSGGFPPPEEEQPDGGIPTGEAAFQPLHSDEPGDWRVARRLLSLGRLIDGISARLMNDELADAAGLRAAGWGRYLRLRGRFVLRLRVSLTAWRESAVTPLWCEMHDSWSGVGVPLRSIEGRFAGARSDDNGGLALPIRLRTDVARDRVIADAIEQMHGVADKLEEADPGVGDGHASGVGV